MSPRRVRRLKTSHSSEALLLRQVPYGEADLILTLLTEKLGKISAIARNLRSAKHRHSMVLEPIHTLKVLLDESPGVEMMVLRESRLECVRHHLVQRLDALDVAGQGLRWVRRLAPPRIVEPQIWTEMTTFLRHLDQKDSCPPYRGLLAGLGLRLLREVGYGFEWQACVRCRKTCPERASSFFDALQGGLICSTCGKGPVLLRSEVRQALLQAEKTGSDGPPEGDAEDVLGWIELALTAHLG